MNVPFLHPTDATLSAVALGDLRAVDAEHTGAHIADCTRCSARVRSVRSMRGMLQVAHNETADETVLDRALARRRAGERVLLPDPYENITAPLRATSRTRVLTTAALVSIAAAAVLAVVLWPRTTARPKPRASDATVVAAKSLPSDGSDGSNASAPLPDAERFSIWPAFAYAAMPPQNAEAEYPAVTVLDPTLLRSGERFYVRSSASAYSDYKPFSAQSVRVSDTTWRGDSVWRVVLQEYLLSSHPRVDTAWIRKRDFRLLARRYAGFSSRTIERILGDSVLEHTTTVTPPAEMAARIKPSLLTNTKRIPLRPGRILANDQSSFMLLVRILPLHATWRGSIDVNRSLTSAVLAYPRSLNISVQGDSTVSTLWGRVPCWRVVLHTGPTPERWYVSKEGHEVLLVTGPAATNWPRSRLDLIGRYLK